MAKTRKRLLAFIIAFVMTMGNSIAVFADYEDGGTNAQIVGQACNDDSLGCNDDNMYLGEADYYEDGDDAVDEETTEDDEEDGKPGTERPSVFFAPIGRGGIQAFGAQIAPATGLIGPVAGSTWSFAGVFTSGGGSFNGGSWYWDATTLTLTLTDILFTTTAQPALFVPGNTTIVLNGTNEMITTYTGMGLSDGIVAYGNLTVSGSGALTAQGGVAGDSAGIWIQGNFTVESGIITVTGGNSPISYGILSSGTVTINGGVVNVSGDGYSIYADGGLTVGSEAELNVINGAISAGGAERFIVTFNPSGGTVDPTSAITQAGGTLASLPTPTRGNDIFGGWFTEATGGTKVDPTYVFTANTTVYAQWIPPFAVSVEVIGGNGTVSMTAGTNPAFDGSSATFTAVPDSGFWVREWTNNGVVVAGHRSNIFTISNISEEHKVTVEFEEVPPAEEERDNSALPAGLTPSHSFGVGGSTFVQGSGAPIIIIVQQDFALFREVRVGGSRLLWGPDFSATWGSTVITLRPQYLETLPLGQHSVEVRFADGANMWTAITVAAAPDVTQPVAPDMNRPAIQPVPLPFEDVLPWDWFYPFVRIVWENQLFQGTSDNTFAPQNTMTRAMFVQVLANLAEVVEKGEIAGQTRNDSDGNNEVVILASESESPHFADVSLTAWHFAAIEWAAKQGIISADDSNFEPERAITREEMAVFLNSFIVSSGITILQGEVTLFTDQDSISEEAIGAVRAMQAAGIILGYPDGRFAPNDTATRAEVAAIFARFVILANLHQ